MEKKWFALYTKPRWEKKVHLLLTGKGLESYCPLNKVQKKWSDRMKTVEEPLFKSYIFVHVVEEQKTEVRMTPGVINYVYWQGKPAEVKQEEIDVIRRFLKEHEQVRAEPLDFKTDQTVRIYSGVLMDREAKVIRVKGSHVEVVIESLGYKLVATIEKRNIGHV
jgi:transcription antitermination factor NusG